MKGKFLLPKERSGPEPNIYADKSALILDWILTKGIEKKHFSLTEVAKEKKVSLGLAQKVFSTMVGLGFLKVEGVRTSKKFMISDSKKLLESWTNHYNIMNKCRVRSYSSGFGSRQELEEVLLEENDKLKVVKALHSAAEAHDCKHTNLDSLELYLVDSSQRIKVENKLNLQPRERGYEVLLIEPYYKKIVQNCFLEHDSKDALPYTSPVLTYIDLFHFPLRGNEQAEYLARKLDLF